MDTIRWDSVTNQFVKDVADPATGAITTVPANTADVASLSNASSPTYQNPNSSINTVGGTGSMDAAGNYTPAGNGGSLNNLGSAPTSTFGVSNANWGNMGSGAMAGIQAGGAAAGSGMSKGASAGTGLVTGAASGAMVGGPPGAVVGGLMGAATGALGGGDEGTDWEQELTKQQALRLKDVRQQLYADPALTPYAGSYAPNVNYTVRKMPERVEKLSGDVKGGNWKPGAFLKEGADTRNKMWEMQGNPYVLGSKVGRGISAVVSGAALVGIAGVIRAMFGPRPKL